MYPIGKSDDERVLRECVRLILEDDSGYGGGELGMGPYGAHFGGAQDLYNVFVKPFSDVIGVASGKAKELTQKGVTLAKVAFEAVATTLVPILADDYKKTFAVEKKKIDSIKQQYADVYESTWDAFKQHDVLFAAFAYSPIAFFTLSFAGKRPKTTARLASVLTDGSLDRYFGHTQSRFNDYQFWDVGSSVHEATAPIDSRQNLARALVSKEVIDSVSSSPKTQQLQKAGKEAVRNSLEHVYATAQNVTRAKDLASLQKIVGKSIPELNKLQQVPQQERAEAEQATLSTIKKTTIGFFAKSLEAQANDAMKAGVPQDHPYVRDVMNVVSKLNSLH